MSSSSPPSPPSVPYQAYKSKRHSRNVSNPNLAPLAVLSKSTKQPIEEQRSLSSDGHSVGLSSSSLRTAGQPSINNVELSPRNTTSFLVTNKESSHFVSSSVSSSPLVASDTEVIYSHSSPSSPRTPTPRQVLGAHLSSQQTLHTKTPNTPGTAFAFSTSSALPAPQSPNIQARKKTTFRRVPVRSTDTLETSCTSKQRLNSLVVPEEPGNSALSSATRSIKVQSDPPTTTVRASSSEHKITQLKVHDMPHRIVSTSLIPTPPPTAITPTRVSSSQSSNLRVQTPSLVRSAAPYRPGFQPKGVYRPLTDEFLALRRQKHDDKTSGGGSSLNRVERTKLERRLEKLIMLHFPYGEQSPNGRPVFNDGRRSSSFFDIESFRNMSVVDTVDKWKNALANGIADNTKYDIRTSEQRITPWQNDADVSKCPLCSTAFHPLTNRKHHCRLCGKIVCSLPPKYPQRPTSCSLLFVVDPQSREIEEVGEGVDYGVKRRTKDGQQKSDEDKFLRGVRICRDCRPVVRRQQYQQEIQRMPHFMELYKTFLSQEKVIQDALPQFQELVLNLSYNDQPTKEAYTARKGLLEAFAQYDALSKEIRRLPCPNGPGSSQDRIQMAILTRANIFLQKNMFPLQSLPTRGKVIGTKADALEASETSPSDHVVLDPESDLARKVQPLLEQEALLESFIEEAKAHRKFEDVKTLKANLREVQLEIEKLLA